MSEEFASGVQVGHTIAEKYRLMRLLSTGGMGTVYESLHAFTHRRVALKLIDQSLVNRSPTTPERFFREATAAAAIGHPGIVDVLDAGQLPDGSLYLAFELLEGEDLEVALDRNVVSDAELIEIAIEVLEILAAAHARGFVHRDIKPSNVFLMKRNPGDRRVKLLDFGIAKRTDPWLDADVTGIGRIVGTPEYMSPEQVQSGTIDAKSDLWSLGTLLFRGFAGESPFLGTSIADTARKLVLGPVPSLRQARPDLPDSVIEAVERALKRAPSERWESAIEMRAALARCELIGGTIAPIDENSLPTAQLCSKDIAPVSERFSIEKTDHGPARPTSAIKEPESVRVGKSADDTIDVTVDQTVDQTIDQLWDRVEDRTEDRTVGRTPVKAQPEPKDARRWVVLLAAILGIGVVGLGWALGQSMVRVPAVSAPPIEASNAPAPRVEANVETNVQAKVEVNVGTPVEAHDEVPSVDRTNDPPRAPVAESPKQAPHPAKLAPPVRKASVPPPPRVEKKPTKPKFDEPIREFR